MAVTGAVAAVLLVLLVRGEGATTPSPLLSSPSATPSGLRGSAADGSPYAFWAVDHRGGPLRWDACTPIRFVLNPRNAPEEAEQDLRTALEILARATGLQLVLAGLTDEEPDARRALVTQERSGVVWQPVLVAWVRPGEIAVGLTALDRGIALPVAVRDGDREAYVTGQVILNADRDDLRPGFGDRKDAIGATLLHELAHLLGLDHVDDPQQLLSVDPGQGPVELGSGDRAGLELLGRSAGCNPAPPANVGRGLQVRD